jgi:hypothetical protein
MVIMAASKGQQALDRLSNNDPVPNGLFTRELIKHMRTQGLSAGEMLKRVRTGVETAAKGVNHEQRPSMVDESSSDFFFYPGGSAPAPAAAPGPAPAPAPTPQVAAPVPAPAPAPIAAPAPPPLSTAPAPSPGAAPVTAATAQREFDGWEQALRGNSRAAFEEFLRQFPGGRYADRARSRIAEFGAPPPAAAAAPAAPAPGPKPAAGSNPAAEFEMWDRAQSSNKRADYEAYLRQYPSGRYADRARAAIPKSQP